MTKTITNVPWMKELSVAAKQAAGSTSGIGEPYTPPTLPGAFVAPQLSESNSDISPAAKSINIFGSIKWGTIGFVAGIAFWNIINFWSFVGQAVFPSPKEPSAYELALRDNAVKLATTPKDTSSIAPDENAAREEALSSCVALAIDRRSKRTYSMPCQSANKTMQKNGQLRTAARTDKF